MIKWNDTNIILIIGFSITIILILLSHSMKFFVKLIKRAKYKTLGTTSKVRFLHQLNEAVKELSAKKIGALITIEDKVSLENFRTDGVIISSSISSQLILALFQKESPLHDGAVVISGSKIKYAGTFYKITNLSVANRYGARHRAALGISEETDSTTIVVSEETGAISIVKNGVIKTIRLDDLQNQILKSIQN